MNVLSSLKHVYQIGLVFGMFAVAILGVNFAANLVSPASATTSCDAVNVIYCGLSGSSTSAHIAALKSAYDNNTSNHPTAYHDVKTIYNYVGASQSLIDGMNTSNTIVGYVWRSGEVTNARGEIIATNAYSVGRFVTTHSVLIPGTKNAHIRPTTDSFASPVLAAIIRLDSNGNMLFGSMISCGNAFKATPVVKPKPVPPVVVTPTPTPPTPAPDYTVVKEVAVSGSTTYAPSVTVNYGTHVIYRITVTSNGAIPVKSVATNDVLPSGIKYVTGTIAVNGSRTGTTLFEDVSVSDGYRIASLDNGSSTVLTFEAIVGPNDTATSCTPGTIDNTATITQKVAQYGVPLLLPKSSTATVNKTCIPPVVTPPPVVKTAIVTTVVTTPPPVVVATVTPPPVTPPPVTPPPVTPPVVPPVVATCTNLTLLTSTLNPLLATATVAYTASTGVALTNVSFNWNDNYLTNNGVATSAQHTYAAYGTYVITATLSFSNGATALPQSICQASVTFSAVAPPVITPIVPTVLPNTGPGSTFALFAGVSAIGTLGYRLFLGRRFAGIIAD